MSLPHPIGSQKLAALGEVSLLRLLLESLEAVERDWNDETLRRSRLRELRTLLAGASTLPDRPPLVVDLADGAGREMDLRHLTALMVPVERALDRRMRDEDLLPVTDDPTAVPDRMPVRVVVDSFRSSFNVGGIFRTGECFGIEEIVLTGYSATPQERRTAKAAMGTEAVVPWRQMRRAEDAIREYKASSIQVIALESGKEHATLDDADLHFPCAVLLGNERFGLLPSALEHADVVVRIPTYGRKNSLNVVAACSVFLHELRCRWERARRERCSR